MCQWAFGVTSQLGNIKNMIVELNKRELTVSSGFFVHWHFPGFCSASIGVEHISFNTRFWVKKIGTNARVISICLERDVKFWPSIGHESSDPASEQEQMPIQDANATAIKNHQSGSRPKRLITSRYVNHDRQLTTDALLKGTEPERRSVFRTFSRSRNGVQVTMSNVHKTPTSVARVRDDHWPAGKRWNSGTGLRIKHRRNSSSWFRSSVNLDGRASRETITRRQSRLLHSSHCCLFFFAAARSTGKKN